MIIFRTYIHLRGLWPTKFLFGNLFIYFENLLKPKSNSKRENVSPKKKEKIMCRGRGVVELNY